MTTIQRVAGTTYSEPVALVLEICCNCAMPFAVSTEFKRIRQADGQWFYCPMGHAQCYSETTESRLKKQLAQEQHRREQLEAERTRLREQGKAKDRQLIAARGQITRVKNRIAKGACPCCKRWFGDLRRHMLVKHPEYAQEPVEGETQ